MAQCPYCGGEIQENVQKCRHCGEWLKGRPSQPYHVTVNNPPAREDMTLTILTLVFYIFMWPVGFVLNLVGLLAGPKRGCHFWMMVVFLLLPILAAVVFFVFMGGLAVLSEYSAQ